MPFLLDTRAFTGCHKLARRSARSILGEDITQRRKIEARRLKVPWDKLPPSLLLARIQLPCKTAKRQQPPHPLNSTLRVIGKHSGGVMPLLRTRDPVINGVKKGGNIERFGNVGIKSVRLPFIRRTISIPSTQCDNWGALRSRTFLSFPNYL